MASEIYDIVTSNVKSADLLSVANYNTYNPHPDFPDEKDATGAYVNKIRPIKSGGVWWLNAGNSNAAEYTRYVSVVHNFKVDRYNGPTNAMLKVRPALTLNSSILANVAGRRVGDLVRFADMMWIIITGTFVVCEDCIGSSPFNKDWKSPYAQYYTNIPNPEGGTALKSTVKQYIDDWLTYWKS